MLFAETYGDEDAAIRQRGALCDEVERRLRFFERITDWRRILIVNPKV